MTIKALWQIQVADNIYKKINKWIKQINKYKWKRKKKTKKTKFTEKKEKSKNRKSKWINKHIYKINKLDIR